MGKQKGFVIPLIISIIAILAIGGGFYLYKTKKVETQENNPVTSSNVTNEWNSFEISPSIEGPNFKIIYPEGWSVSDLSFPICGNFDSITGVLSTSRSDLPGNDGISASYLVQYCVSADKYIVAFQGFIKVPLNHQPTESDKIFLSDGDLKNTNEYKIAQQIISTSGFVPVSYSSATTSTATTTDVTVGWKTYTNSKYGYSFQYPAEAKIYDDCCQGSMLADLSVYYPSNSTDATDGMELNKVVRLQLHDGIDTSTNTGIGQDNYNSKLITRGKMGMSIWVSDVGYKDIFKTIVSTFKFTETKTSCTPNWSCGWGSCSNGYQSQTAIDSNNCGLSSTGVQIACPALAKACVTNEPITSSVSVIYPNGGEVLNIGLDYIIKWYDDTDAGNKDIQLINQSTGLTSSIVANYFTRSSGIDGTFSYQWKISNLLSTGKYKIKICKSGTSECGMSSNFFEIK